MLAADHITSIDRLKKEDDQRRRDKKDRHRRQEELHAMRTGGQLGSARLNTTLDTTLDTTLEDGDDGTTPFPSCRF